MPLISDTQTTDTIKESTNNFPQSNALYSNISGDQVVMAMLKGMNAQNAIKNSANLFDKNKAIINNKLKELIICSDESNADYTARNSNAFVCWINNESNQLTKESYQSLSQIAQNIYIMFDIDNIGKRKAQNIALKHLDIRIIYLPDKLKKIKSPETQKFCKSAKEYFSFYAPEIMEKFNEGKYTHFERLKNSSLPLRFWIIKNNKYKINLACIYNFLSAQGIYRNASKNNKPYIYIKDHTKEDFSKKEIIIKARELMISFIRFSPEYNEELIETIYTTTLRVENLPVFDSDEEYNMTSNIDHTNSVNKKLISIIGEKSTEFFNIFFAKKYNYNCPIDRETLFIDYKNYKDDSDFDKMSSRKFKSELDSYCKISLIKINPPIVLQNKSDKKRKEVRIKAWCKKEENGTPNKYYRELTSSKGALYFYKQDEEPSNIGQIGKAPEIDPELG